MHSRRLLGSVALAGMLVSGRAMCADSTTTSSPLLLAGDMPMRIAFHGTPEADIFSREVSESLNGTLAKNCRYTTDPAHAGFLSSSVDGRPWTGTMWTRDAGTYLREAVHYGCIGRAKLLTKYLIRYVATNADGYFTYPEYMLPGVPSSGTELDGTSSIVIGMVLLWERLNAEDPARMEIYDFLHGKASPLRYMAAELAKHPLLAGTGEFGGGCGIPGVYVNVVQNALVRYTLLAGARLERSAGANADAAAYERCARQIGDNMLKHLVAPDQTWTWCVKPDTLMADPAINNHEINLGFGGLNGIAAMYSDVEGLDPAKSDWPGMRISLNTFRKLADTPLRKAQYEKYGIWTQFDVFREGLNMSPSYGHGYALQVMLLFDQLAQAEKGINYLANATYQLLPGYILNRDSPYWFFEQYYSPDFKGRPYAEACGALNIVNVAEPLKVARLIVGVDDSSATETKIIPRLPPGWNGYEARDVPVRTATGTARMDIQYTRKPALILKVKSGPPIPRVSVRVGLTEGSWKSKEHVQDEVF